MVTMTSQGWAILTAIGGSLVAVVGILWKMLQTVWSERKERLLRFEEREVEINKKIEKLTSDVSLLKGREEGQALVLETTVKAVTDVIQQSQKDLIEYYKGKKDE